MDPPAPNKTKPRRHKRIARALIAAAIALVLLWFVAPLAVEPLLRRKLEALVANHLHADLQMGNLIYRPPYTLRLRDARLVTTSAQSGDVQVLDVAHLEMVLARFPLRPGPLLIEKLDLQDPVFHIVRMSSGKLAGADLLRPDVQQLPPKQRLKLSDLFRLRRLKMQGAQIVCEDRRREKTAPMVWRNLNVDLNIVPHSAADYQFHFTGNESPLLTLSADGSINIDTLVLELEKFALDAQAQPDGATTAMPATVQELLQKHGVSGRVNLSLAGTIPLGEPHQTRLTVDAAAHFADGGGSIELQGALGNTIEASNLSAELHDLTFLPPKFSIPLQHVSGSVRLADRAISIVSLHARYGNDDWSLASAQIPLDGIAQRLQINSADARIIFNDPATPYPLQLGPVVRELNPGGAIALRGEYLLDRTGDVLKYQYQILLTSEDAKFMLTPRRIPVTKIRGEAFITPDSLEIRRFLAEAFGGVLAANGSIDTRQPMSYTGVLSLDDVNLAAVSQYFPKSDGKLSGRGRLKAQISAEAPTLAALHARGEAELFEAQLWQQPVLSSVVRELKLAEEALTVAEAAAVFDIAGSEIQLHQAAINSPALGLHGSGKINLDGALHLDLVAAPLGDWERNLKKMKIPIVSDVAATVFGGFQKMLNKATQQLLYEFRVAGNLSDPKLEAVPSPVLTETVAAVFGTMLRKDYPLLESLRQKPETRK